MRTVDLENFVKTAVECSVFLSPTNFGLTEAEIIEVGKRLGLLEGELRDAIRDARRREDVQQYWGKPYLQPKPNFTWATFLWRDEPDFRNIRAFDFVQRQLLQIAREQGAQNAQIERSVLIERGVAAGFTRLDVEATITALILAQHYTEKGNVVRLDAHHAGYPLASEQASQVDEDVRVDETKRQVYSLVADVIARRSDGRPSAAEPLDAFAEVLERLGYKPFRMWWVQMVAEVRKLEATISPVSATVLSAALVEGALTFLVRHARTLSTGPFKSSDFDGAPRTWKIDDLVRSAATGGDAAVFDQSTRQRADELIRTRQRIHAGRMLSEHPGGPPDLRPEEARDALRTAELVVRKILDWLQMHPPSA